MTMIGAVKMEWTNLVIHVRVVHLQPSQCSARAVGAFSNTDHKVDPEAKVMH